MLSLYLESFREPSKEPPTPQAMSKEQLRKSLAYTQSVMVSELKDDSTRKKFLEYLARLEPSFIRFKRTKACAALKQQIQAAEKIAERVINIE